MSEPKIRNEFQYDLIHSNSLINSFVSKNYITFTSENQIINENNELKRTDIEFIINGVVKFVVECKKLKTANKEQYINKGISRFTNQIYINENDKYAGMCSFIVDGEVASIIKGIKDKIQDRNFISVNENEICDFEFSFTSTHSKNNNNDTVSLYHLFFDIKPE